MKMSVLTKQDLQVVKTYLLNEAGTMGIEVPETEIAGLCVSDVILDVVMRADAKARELPPSKERAALRNFSKTWLMDYTTVFLAEAEEMPDQPAGVLDPTQEEMPF